MPRFHDKTGKTMTQNFTTFDMPPTMAHEDCQRLHSFLRAAVDQPVALNCAAVERLNGLAAQTIKMAQCAWAANNITFKLINMTPPITDGFATLGLSDLIENEGTA